MSFVIQRSSGRGLSLTQVRRDVLRIGRGTNAELRSENPAVALEHAVIEGDANGFTITDKGSITGTYVNRRPVETARLARGDVIEIGDLRIEVQVLDPGKPLFVRLSSAGSAAGYVGDDDDEAVVPRAVGLRGDAIKAPKKIDYVDVFRLKRTWLTKLSLIAILLIVSFLAVAEITKPEKQNAFMPGGLATGHARTRDPKSGELIGNHCDACHDPWRGVSDSGCVKCHAKLPLAGVTLPHAKNLTGAPPCADCHPEHRAVPKIDKAADATCVSCHGNILAHVKDSSALSTRPRDVLRITSFGKQHPEFVPRSDPDTLLFNHALHLKAGGVYGNGRGVLRCVQCHQLVETKGVLDPGPVKFNNACKQCHQLTFDLRFPDKEVPHGGDAGMVLGYVQAMYAGNRDVVGKSPEEVRRILTSRPQVALDQRAQIAFEHVMKTKCSKCHVIDRSGRGIAAKPEIPVRWLLKGKFTHTQHQDQPCESCHDKARQSTKTSDVLIPQRNACTGCHGGQSAKIPSSCAKCHEYHGRLSPSSGKGLPLLSREFGGGSRMIETVLLWAIVLLLLVVLVPVGMALVQRIRAGTPDRRSAPRGPYEPPPTDKVPGLSDTPAATPSPGAGATSVPVKAVEATKLAPVPTSEPEGSGTEMVEWHGMIQCTSGELEGQHFIIEKEGLYIGRDPAMSQVAIRDNRVSKRHVRIIPRDGKVMAIDQNSTNGTFLAKAGGERITEVVLKRGDVLVLADNAATFVYQI